MVHPKGAVPHSFGSGTSQCVHCTQCVHNVYSEQIHWNCVILSTSFFHLFPLQILLKIWIYKDCCVNEGTDNMLLDVLTGCQPRTVILLGKDNIHCCIFICLLGRHYWVQCISLLNCYWFIGFYISRIFNCSNASQLCGVIKIFEECLSNSWIYTIKIWSSSEGKNWSNLVLSRST